LSGGLAGEGMGLPENIEDLLAENEALLLEPRDEYDSCVVGIGYRFHAGPLAVYSIPKTIKVMKGWGMDEDEAQEFFDFNTLGAWMGDGTPVFVHLFSEGLQP
jgi:hypothetical protein